MPFEDYLPKTLPPWLRKQWGQAFHVAVGRRMDAIAETYRQAIFARMPTIAAGNDDDAALEAIGYDRQLPRGSGEAAGAYGDRLFLAWEAWAGDNTPSTGVGGGAGSPLGMLNAIKAAGIPTGPDGATIVQQNGRYAQLDVDGALVLGTLMDCVNRQTLTGDLLTRPGWMFDGRDNFYSIFGIVFPEPASFDAALLNAAVERWRPSKALYAGAWIIESGRLLGWPATGRTLGTEPDLGGNIITFVPGASRDDRRIGLYQNFEYLDRTPTKHSYLVTDFSGPAEDGFTGPIVLSFNDVLDPSTVILDVQYDTLPTTEPALSTYAPSSTVRIWLRDTPTWGLSLVVSGKTIEVHCDGGVDGDPPESFLTQLGTSPTRLRIHLTSGIKSADGIPLMAVNPGGYNWQDDST